MHGFPHFCRSSGRFRDGPGPAAGRISDETYETVPIFYVPESSGTELAGGKTPGDERAQRVWSGGRIGGSARPKNRETRETRENLEKHRNRGKQRKKQQLAVAVF